MLYHPIIFNFKWLKQKKKKKKKKSATEKQHLLNIETLQELTNLSWRKTLPN